MPIATRTSRHFLPSPVRYIAGLAGTGTGAYFADQYGQPRLLVSEQAWALPWNAGRWGGTYQTDMTAYLAARSAQGHTAWFGVAWPDGNIDASPPSGSRIYDGTYILTVNGTPGVISTGSETVALNPAYWARLDYLFTSALACGISCFLCLGLSYDFGSTNGLAGIWANATTTQLQQFGAALATRYPQASYPNVHWTFGDDDQGGNDAAYSAILTGIRNAGDTRTLISCEQYGETNSQIEFDTGAAYPSATGFGNINATWNWVYTYNPPYLGLEASYTESGRTPIPAAWADGPYYGDNSPDADAMIRRYTWWALASGARGVANTSGPGGSQGSGTIWAWQSGAAAACTTDPEGTWITSRAAAVIAYFTALPGWHHLTPDTGSALVTSGRGTRATSPGPGFGSMNYGGSDNYVAASRTADGTLAVIYCGQHFTIGINETLIGGAGNYTATWVDPSSCATSAATPGSSYSSTGKGNNSAGDPDWALILKAL